MTLQEGGNAMATKIEMETVSTETAVLGDLACGSIDPDARAERGEISRERVDEVCCNIGSHYTWVGDKLMDQEEVDAEFYKMFIPKWCVDGRTDDGETELGANAAGGTYSLVVGDALVNADYLVENKIDSAKHGEEMFADLTERGFDVGVHCADHVSGEGCGCGACDKMADIFVFMANNMDKLSERAAALGVEIGEQQQDMFTNNIKMLLGAGYISSGKAMNQAAVNVTDESHNQKLTGDHNEVVLVVNTVTGTTLDRESLAEKFGEEYEAFNLDVWALKTGIDAVSRSEAEASDKFAASVLYNLATAYVLAGPSLRVVVR